MLHMLQSRGHYRIFKNIHTSYICYNGYQYPLYYNTKKLNGHSTVKLDNITKILFHGFRQTKTIRKVVYLCISLIKFSLSRVRTVVSSQRRLKLLLQLSCLSSSVFWRVRLLASKTASFYPCLRGKPQYI